MSLEKENYRIYVILYIYTVIFEYLAKPNKKGPFGPFYYFLPIGLFSFGFSVILPKPSFLK
ncbi:hypothetical protein VcTj87_19110 [Vibrio comitans]